MQKKIKIGLIGLGTVGSGVFKTLKNFDNIEIAKIAVKNINKPRNIEGLNRSLLTDNPCEVVQNPDIDIESLENKINTLIYGTLGEAKLPHYIEYHEALPKSDNGKLAWNVLQAADNEKYKSDTLEKETNTNVKVLK